MVCLSIVVSFSHRDARGIRTHFLASKASAVNDRGFAPDAQAAQQRI